LSRAYCQYPVCNPSRTSLLSGLYPESTGVISNDTDLRKTRPGTITMPRFFRDAGYWTARTGKVFHNPATNHALE
jgi:arylsulfatase A-like enzyme